MSKVRNGIRRAVASLVAITTFAVPQLQGIATPVYAATTAPVVMKKYNPFDAIMTKVLIGGDQAARADIMTVTIDGKEYIAYCLNPTKYGSENVIGSTPSEPTASDVGKSGYSVEVYDIDDPALQSIQSYSQDETALKYLQGVISKGGYYGGGDSAAKQLKDPYDSGRQLFNDENEAYAITKYAVWSCVLTTAPANNFYANPNASAYKGREDYLMTSLVDIYGSASNWQTFNDDNIYAIVQADSTGNSWVEDVDNGGSYAIFNVQSGKLGDNRSQNVNIENKMEITPSTLPSGFHLEQMDGTKITGKTTLNSLQFKVVADEGTDLSTLGASTPVATISANIQTFKFKYGVAKTSKTSVPQNYALVPVDTWETVQTVATLGANPVPENYSLKIQKVDGSKGLAGAKFRVTNDSGFDTTVTTPSSGVVTVGLDTPGTYYVEEIEAPSGYALDSTKRSVTVQAGGPTEVNVKVDNSKSSGLRIFKLDALTDEGLPGATFRVENIDGTFSTEVITGDMGIVLLDGLKPGSYVVTEINPPAGYQNLDNPVKTIEIEKDQTTVQQLVFKNNPINGTLKIIKTAENSGDPIEGVTFTIRQRDGAEQWSVTTDAKGEATIDIPADWYTVTETDAPDNVEVDSTPHTVELEPGKTYELRLTNVLRKTLIVEKRDSVDNSLVPGMVFEIKSPTGDMYGAGNCGRGEGIYEVGADGQITFDNMITGTSWVITEVEAPDGYVLNTTPQTVKIENDVTTVTIRNDRKPGLLLTKVDSDTGKRIMGAKFTFSIPGTNTSYTRVTDNNGIIFLEDLDITSIVIQEIEPAAGYIANVTPVTVQLVPNERTDVTFKNTSKPGLRIYKVDTDGNPVAGVVVELSKANGESLGEYTTDDAGTIYVGNLEAGTYEVTEKSAPEQYVIDTSVHKIVLEPGKIGEITIRNNIKPTLKIVKLDSVTKSPIKGITFEVKITDGNVLGNYVTDANGEIIITNLTNGVNYTVTEKATLTGYILDPTPKQITVHSDQISVLTFENKAKSPVYIVKLDSETGEGIAGVRFKVTKADGSLINEVTTDANGRATLTNVPAGYITVTEVYVPDGYVLDPTPQTKLVDGENPVEFTFYNKPYGNLVIKKVNAENQNPLSGAIFKVTESDGTVVGERYVSGADGTVLISSLDPNKTYIVTEIQAPNGFVISEGAKTVTIKAGETKEVVFEDKRIESFTISKTDTDGNPIAGVTFVVSTITGAEVARVTTGVDGLAVINDIKPGSYKVQEISVPDGVIIDPTPKTVEVKAGEPTFVKFVNERIMEFVINKTDTEGKPIAGVSFEVKKLNGEYITKVTTDATGMAVLNNIEPGTYVVQEIAVPEGVILDTTPKTVEVSGDKRTIVNFVNERVEDFIIKKIGSDGKPIGNVTFTICTIGGIEKYRATTGLDGLAILTDVTPGTYKVQEIAVPDGVILDPTPQLVEVKAGKETQLTFVNDYVGGVKIYKKVAQTGSPLKNVTFRISKVNGEVIGEYTTDENGEIFVELEPQTIRIQEIKAPSGYKIDTTSKTVEIKANEITTVTFENERLGGITIYKVDADTHRGLYRAHFLLMDEDRHTIAELVTDRDGYAEYDDELPDGIYYIREIKAPSGYTLDERIKRIVVKNGSTEEIYWENSKTRGQIQIVKKSSDYNPITGAAAGSLLEGAIFEISNAETGVVVDRIVSDYRGVAASSPLRLGRYKVKEITAPAFYQLNSTEFEVQLKVANDIVRVEMLNSSATIGTSIKKQGNTTVVPGQQMRYDFYDIINNSNVALSNFYWHDELPSAVRLVTISTGTWTQPGKTYSVTYKTNINSTYRTLASGLLTTQSYDLDCTASRLGLLSNEYITDFRFEFGDVVAGFREASRPMILVNVQPGLASGYRFANRVDAGGMYSGKWFTSSFTWVTEVFGQQFQYPTTGY